MNQLTALSPKHHVVLLVSIFLTAVTPSYAQKPKPGSPNYNVKAAETIDKHIAKHFAKNKIKEPNQVSDEKILRRTYLALSGRIPTLEEVKSYTSSSHPYKRDMLAQRLLNSEGYNSHMTNYFFDLFRAQEKLNSRGSLAPYQAWLRKAVETNKKWNKLTRELVTATGSIWRNGAVGYYVRDRGMELDNMASTMRLFTGTRLECAQCHDHPYNEKFDRMDFYRLAAFAEGFKEYNTKAFYQLSKNLNNAGQGRSDYKRFVDFIKENIAYTSRKGTGVGRIKLPYDYQYNDGDPHEIVGARTPFSKSIRMTDRKDGDDGIQRLANWMTVNNDRFTSVITNRMWKRIMGTGLYEPEDEYVEPSKTAIPELTNFLSKLMLELNYDLKAFQNVLLLTKVYGFETSSIQFNNAYYNQNGRQLRRLSAEQIWDSFVTLKKGNPEKLPKRQYPKIMYYRNKPVGAGSQNMAVIANEVLAVKDAPSLDKLLRSLYQSVGKSSAPPMIMGRIQHNGALAGFVRASEISSPAPAGHMLREFGQSDRDLIQNASTEANVNQVLSILNGHVEKLIISDKNAHVHQGVSNTQSIEQNITNLFLSTLTRKPSKVELIVFREEIEQSGKKGYRNILAALLTSREFLFVQ